MKSFTAILILSSMLITIGYARPRDFEAVANRDDPEEASTTSSGNTNQEATVGDTNEASTPKESAIEVTTEGKAAEEVTKGDGAEKVTKGDGAEEVVTESNTSEGNGPTKPPKSGGVPWRIIGIGGAVAAAIVGLFAFMG